MRNTSRWIATVTAVLVTALLLTSACGSDDETSETPTIPSVTEPTTEATSDLNQPPKNPFLADSPWATNHGNSYRQDSSTYAGPTEPPTGEIEDFLLGRPGTTNLEFSSPYPDGGRVIWSSSYGIVFKADPNGQRLAYIDKIESRDVQWIGDDMSAKLADQSAKEVSEVFGGLVPPQPEPREGESIGGASGIYVVMGSDQIFYVPLDKRIVAYGDKVEGDRLSPIEIKREFQIPENMLTREWDKIMGLVMTYDGRLAFATNYGLIGMIDRTFTDVHYLQLADGEEYIFNNLATDEDGGIYVATHKAVYRVQWTGEDLTIDESKGGWRAEYGTGNPSQLTVQTQAGSGSTPSLMGTGDQDKFVVITDGEELMNIVLLWRNEIPDDWEQLPGTRSRRIAAQVPVTFGDPERERSFSDQSVLVRGYGAFAVNNEMQKYEDTVPENVLLGGEGDHQPFGCEKFEWDPQSREFRSVWVNQEISLPNAVPTMSASTNLIYSIGSRDGTWTLEAIDWDTGESAFHYEIGDKTRHNSAFATCEVGPDSAIYYGTYFGFIRIRPSTTQLPCDTTSKKETASEPESAPQAQGPTWTYNVNYGDENTVWSSQVTDEEVINGTESYIIQTSFDNVPKRRSYSAQISGYADLDLLSEALWLDRNALQPVKKEQNNKAMGAFDVTTTTNYTYAGSYGAPLSEGDSWGYEAELVPSIGNPVTSTWQAEVVGTEEITVTAGTYNCYKIVCTKEADSTTRTEWWSAEGDPLAPIKVVDETTYEFTESRELASYESVQ